MTDRGGGIRNPAVIGLMVSALIGVGLGWQDASESSGSAEIAADSSAQGLRADEVVARVGEVPLLTVELETKLREMGVDPAGADESQESAALDALIDEELWLREALATDRLRHHRGLRDAVARRMLDVIFPAADDFDESALKRLYEEKYLADPEAPPFEKVRFRLEKEQTRIRNSRALEQYLLWLRQSTDVEMLAEKSDLEGLQAAVYGRDGDVESGSLPPGGTEGEGGSAAETHGAAAGGEGEP